VEVSQDENLTYLEAGIWAGVPLDAFLEASGDVQSYIVAGYLAATRRDAVVQMMEEKEREARNDASDA